MSETDCKDFLGIDVCRFCLDKAPEMLSVLSVAEKIYNFLQIEVTSQQPTLICFTCMSKITEWEAFYESVHQNEIKWLPKDERLEPDVLCEEMNPKTAGAQYTIMCIDKEEAAMVTEGEIQELVVSEEEVDDMEDTNVECVDATSVADEERDQEPYEEDSSEEGLQDSNEVPETRRTTLSKRGTNTGNRGRPRKKMPILTTRDHDNEMIRQVVQLTCDVCSDIFTTFEILLDHFRMSHKTDGYVKCCGKTIKKRYVLLEHVRFHLNPDQYACEICGKRFTAKRHLNEHALMHIPEEERQFQCEKCLKRYPTQTRLALHMKAHEEQFLFKCPFCEKAFRQEVVMKNHVKCVHQMTNQHICEICARVFKTKEGFIGHQATHLETPPERLKCEICGGKYKNRETLKYHMLRHKREHERHYCDICNKEFNCKKRMRSHRKYVHATIDEMFPCTICEKTFKRPIFLKEHMAAHTGTLLYTCAYCPKKFNSNANKYSHQKAQHPAEWEMNRRIKLEAC